MSKPVCKANASPCGAVCPRRELPVCRKTCDEWKAYEAEHLAKYNGKVPPMYTGTVTEGSRKRANVNFLIHSGKKKGW